MKVLIYSHGYPNPVEPYRNAFVKELIRFLHQDIDIRVMAPVPFFLNHRRAKSGTKVPLSTQQKLGAKTIRVYYPRYLLLPGNLLKPIIGLIEALCSLPSILLLIRGWKPDLIHANWAYPDGVAVNYISRWTGLPYMITEHQGSIGDLLSKEYYRRLISRVYRESRALVLVSPSLRDPLRKVEGGLPRYKLIPNAIDTDIYTLKDKTPQPSKMVYIGNFYEGKGLKYLIQALAILRDQSAYYSLDIIGGGNEEAEIRALCSELELQDQISFLGRKEPSEIPQSLLNYDFLVLPSLKESFGLVLIEAMAAGLPVLSTLSGGPEYIVSAETGILVEPGSSAALAKGILELTKNWPNYDPQTIRQCVKDKFDLRQSAGQLAELYQSLLNHDAEHRLEKKNMIKVCHLSTVHPRKDIRVFHKECLSLRAAGYDVHEIIADGLPDELYKGVKIHGVAIVSNRMLRMIISPILILMKALELRAKVYHFHDMELLPVGVILRYLGFKVIYDVHDSVPLQIMGKFYVPIHYRKPLAFLMDKLEACLSPHLSAVVGADPNKTKRFSRFNKRVCTVHNYPLLQEIGMQKEGKRDPRSICYVGGITKIRGILQSLDAIRDLDVNFIVAGPFAPESLEDECRRHPSWEKVSYRGFLGRDGIAEVLSTASVGLVNILPSENYLDSLPIKMFEYMSAGIPVVSSNIPHWKAIVDNYRCGIVVDPLKPDEIATAIQYLLDHPEEAREMGQRGRQAILEGLNWDSQIPILLNLYKELLEQ